jgi:tRNA(adenine34) deaminase
MMRRCVELSAGRGEDLPIAAMVCRGVEVLSSGKNEVQARKDLSAHAEVLAMNEARARIGSGDLTGCTLYSTVEPCPMCCFLARQVSISRVVCALSSPVIGGISKWDVLRDPELSDLIPEVFGHVPEVKMGVLAHEAAQAWQQWNSATWAVISERGCFVEDADRGKCLRAIPAQHRWLHTLMGLFKP